MRVPANGEKLVSANGDVWVILRCHRAGDDPSFFAEDVIRQEDARQRPARSISPGTSSRNSAARRA
jgi:hypothetical protein